MLIFLVVSIISLTYRGFTLNIVKGTSLKMIKELTIPRKYAIYEWHVVQSTDFLKEGCLKINGSIPVDHKK